MPRMFHRATSGAHGRGGSAPGGSDRPFVNTTRSTCRTRCLPATPPVVCQGPISYKGQALPSQHSPPSRPPCKGSTWRRLLCPLSRLGWSAEARTSTTPPKKSTCSRARGPEDRIPGHRRCRVHPPDRRSRVGRNVEHDDSGSPAGGVPTHAGQEHRRAQSCPRSLSIKKHLTSSRSSCGH